MALTATGRAALVAREALRTRAYKDSVGVWTIGVGHTSVAGPPTVTPDLVITEAEALGIFARDLVQYERAVDKAVTVPLADHERDALVSICYNIGAGGFARSTFVRRLNAGDRAGAAAAIMAWKKPKEIIGRREGERDQFLTPYETALPKARSTDRARVGGKAPLARAKPRTDRVAVEPAPVLVAPRVEAVAAPTRAEAKADLPLWARWFAPKAKAAAIDRPGLKPGGSAELYDVQVHLRARAYYTKMPPDGLDGPITQAAVAQARKDNGLGDGGVDAAFLAALPTMPNRLVPAEKANAGLREAARMAPELFRAPTWLGALGLGSVGLGSADGTGLLGQLQETTGKVNDVAGSVQSAIGTLSGIIAFAVEHRSWIFVLVGLFVVFKAVSYALDAWIKVRTAFF